MQRTVATVRTRRSSPSRFMLPLIVWFFAGCNQFPVARPTNDLERQGQQIFRDETFGNERFWTDTAKLHEVVREHIQPLEALGLGLKSTWIG